MLSKMKACQVKIVTVSARRIHTAFKVTRFLSLHYFTRHQMINSQTFEAVTSKTILKYFCLPLERPNYSEEEHSLHANNAATRIPVYSITTQFVRRRIPRRLSQTITVEA